MPDTGRSRFNEMLFWLVEKVLHAAARIKTAVSAVVFLHIPAEVFAKRPGVVVVYTGKGCDMECKKEI